MFQIKSPSKVAAKAIAALHRGRVKCEKCGREQAVDASKCFDGGWPKCCGYTMTLLTRPTEPKR